jgi:hypothetical protein
MGLTLLEQQKYMTQPLCIPLVAALMAIQNYLAHLRGQFLLRLLPAL